LDWWNQKKRKESFQQATSNVTESTETLYQPFSSISSDSSSINKPLSPSSSKKTETSAKPRRKRKEKNQEEINLGQPQEQRRRQLELIYYQTYQCRSIGKRVRVHHPLILLIPLIPSLPLPMVKKVQATKIEMNLDSNT